MQMGNTMKNRVKILATSDLHGELDGLASEAAWADILCISGDIQPAVIGIDPKDWFITKFFPMVSRMTCEVVAICGNHDFALASALCAGGDGWLAQNAPKNFHLLMDEAITLNGLTFYGTPWCPTIDGRWCFEKDDEELADYFSRIPKDVDVLLTHTPPRGIDGKRGGALDVSLQNCNSRHFGSDSLLAALKEKTPHVVFCGHIHSGDHAGMLLDGKEHNTLVVNVSRLDEKYRPTYKCRRMVFTGKAIADFGEERGTIGGGLPSSIGGEVGYH